MSSAIILHGTCDREEYADDAYPSLSNSHWLPWLQKQLLIEGYAAHTPEIPRAYAPDYNIWNDEFERYPLDPDSLLVGHSCGGGFFLRWLSENPVQINRLVLVAPWVDPFREKTSDFFDFEIDPALSDRMQFDVLVSDNDSSDIEESASRIRQAVPGARFHLFPGYGHFCAGDVPGIESFPALKAIVLGRTYTPPDPIAGTAQKS